MRAAQTKFSVKNNRWIIPIILCLGITVMLLACNSRSKFDNYKVGYENLQVDTINPKGTEKYVTGNSEFIFNQKALHTFELTLPEKELRKIDANPVDEEYVVGTLTFNGEVVSPVGIRYKGSVGSFVRAVSGNDWAKPSGYKTATKISMKVKINWLDGDKTFYGLKKLQFHSQNMDGSKMHERLGYWLYREMGVYAPRSVHARLIINGLFYGVFALTEQIDSQFVDYHFKDYEGNLYKEVWPLSHTGLPSQKQVYTESLKTNKKDLESPLLIEEFGNEIAQAQEEDLQGLIQKRMYLDQILAYAVVDNMIRNDDGAFHWYCGSEACHNHNYYWYEEPSVQKLHLIPWDLDNAFQNIGYGKLPVTRIHNRWGEISNDCNPFPSYARGIDQKSAACDKLTGVWASFEAEYAVLKAKFIAGPFSERQVFDKLEEWTNQIRASVIEERALHGDAVSEKEWKEELENLKIELEHSRLNY